MVTLAQCYEPIVGHHETRILHLLPGKHDDPLHGWLEHVNIDDKPVYEALSYEWGSPKKQQQMFLDENGSISTLLITESLYHALCDLRPRRATRDGRTIWADGVCINQDDLSEREKQVAFMGLIYRAAIRVITYIGPETEDSNQAIDFAYHLWNSCTTQQKKGAKHPSTTPPFVEITYQSIKKWPTIIEHFAHAHQLVGAELPQESDPCCKALKKLLLRGWAARCWCAQEFLLNEELRLMCGRREIKEWFLLPGVVQLVFNRTLPAFLLPSSFEDPNSLRECLVGLLKARDWRMNNLGQFLSPHLLAYFHALQASDPRDKVYALIGLSSDGHVLPDVDYSRPVENLYIDVAARIVTKYQLIDLLYRNLGEKSLELPSWVPDWSCWRFGTDGMLNDYEHCAGGLGFPFMVANGIILDVAGCVFDSIVRLSDPVGPRYTTTYPEKDGISLVQRDESIRTKQLISNSRWLAAQAAIITGLCQYRKGTCVQSDVLWRTLTTNMNFQEQLAGPEYCAYFHAHLAVSLEQETGDHAQAASSTAQPQNDMAREFCDTVRRRMRYRRLCVTKKEYFGAVPQESRQGDSICLFEGARSLFVVRDARKERGGYELVGPAYVHGLMSGEILEMDEYQKEMIRLV